MGFSKEWIVEIKQDDDVWITKVYGSESKATRDLGLKNRQLIEMLRGRYKKASQNYKVSNRNKIEI